MRSGPAHKRPFGAEGRELVTDATAGLERQAGFVHRAQDAVHGVGHRAGNRAVNGGGGRLVCLGTGVGGDASGRNGAALQRPQETPIPVLALLGGGLNIGQGAGDTAVGIFNALVDGYAGLGLETVLFVPNIIRGRLQGDVEGIRGAGLELNSLHNSRSLLIYGCCYLWLVVAGRTGNSDQKHNILWSAQRLDPTDWGVKNI